MVCYLDDTLIIGDTVEQTRKSVKAVTRGLESLGFLIHPGKSVLEPQRVSNLLGFILNSEDMTLRLPEAKMHEIKQLCSELRLSQSTTIRQVAKVIGKLVAAFPAVLYGPLFYRSIEKDKVVALKLHRGHFDRKMSLSQESKQELQWWVLMSNRRICQLEDLTPQSKSVQMLVVVAGVPLTYTIPQGVGGMKMN